MKHIITKEDLKSFLKENKVLITYLRDKYGYKCGVVVAIGPNRIGFSKVNANQDIRLTQKLSLPPYWHRFEQKFLASNPEPYLVEAMKDAKKAVHLGHIVAPIFDRFTALKLAINMAISDTQVSIPFSMEEALGIMFVRSVLYFRKGEENECYTTHN